MLLIIMPVIQDILPKLNKVEVMSSLDAKNGFWHCVLDHLYGNTIWTVGLSLAENAFGTSPSPEIFQVRMNAALSGLAETACIDDDILIFWYRRHAANRKPLQIITETRVPY